MLFAPPESDSSFEAVFSFWPPLNKYFKGPGNNSFSFIPRLSYSRLFDTNQKKELQLIPSDVLEIKGQSIDT
jgi:hypothetical protein